MSAMKARGMDGGWGRVKGPFWMRINRPLPLLVRILEQLFAQLNKAERTSLFRLARESTTANA